MLIVAIEALDSGISSSIVIAIRPLSISFARNHSGMMRPHSQIIQVGDRLSVRLSFPVICRFVGHQSDDTDDGDVLI